MATIQTFEFVFGKNESNIHESRICSQIEPRIRKTQTYNALCVCCGQTTVYVYPLQTRLKQFQEIGRYDQKRRSVKQRDFYFYVFPSLF
jgi:hypothetical protein